MEVDRPKTNYWKPALVLAGVAGVAVIARVVHGRMNMLETVANQPKPKDWITSLRQHLQGRIKELSGTPRRLSLSTMDATWAIQREKEAITLHLALELQPLGNPKWGQSQWVQLFRTGEVGNFKLPPEQLDSVNRSVRLLDQLSLLDRPGWGAFHMWQDGDYLTSVAELCTKNREELVVRLSSSICTWNSLLAQADDATIEVYAHALKKLVPLELRQLDLMKHTSFSGLGKLADKARSGKDFSLEIELHRLWPKICENRKHWLRLGGANPLSQLSPLAPLEQLEIDELIHQRLEWEVFFHVKKQAYFDIDGWGWQNFPPPPNFHTKFYCNSWSAQEWATYLLESNCRWDGTRPEFAAVTELFKRSGYSREELGSLCIDLFRRLTVNGWRGIQIPDELYQGYYLKLAQMSDNAFTRLITTTDYCRLAYRTV